MSESPYASPESDLSQAGNTEPEKTTLKEVLFSFQGRTGRSGYWLGMLILLIFNMLFSGLIAVADPSEGGSGISVILIVPYIIASIWISLALQIKRWHDRGKSGWWTLINIIPILGALWALIENGALAGDPGVNAYGAPKKL